jgi:aldehyde:ferredoxin oxidoreductase
MMEAGETGSAPEPYARERLPRFGDGARAAELVAEIAQGTPLGKLLGDGAVATGAALGVTRVPAVKGQAMSAYDPRVVKGTGVTYATSPQGADHTAGLTVFFRVDHLDPKLAVSLSRASQIQRAAYDALGLCVFNTSATGQQPGFVLDMLRAQCGLELPDNWLDELGRRVIETEIAFNHAAGFTEKDDRLPEFFTREALSPTNSTFDVAPGDMDRIWDK